MKLFIATTNAGKLREIVPILADLPLELVTLADRAGIEAPPETGPTFEANARAKARYYATATGLLTVAEDSGLQVDALDGAPGVGSARFGGADTSYPQKFALIYEALRAREGIGRQARFVCALALADQERILFEARGTVEGQIAQEPRGQGGFGYDPIFFFPPIGCTLAEAAAEKAAVGHRAEAFRRLRAFLASRLGR